MSPPSTPWPFEVDFRPSGSFCTCTVVMAKDLLLASDSFQNALLLPTWNRRRLLFNSTPTCLLLGSIQTIIHSTQYNRQSATQIKPLTSAWSSSLGCVVVGCALRNHRQPPLWGQQLPVTLAGTTMTIRRQSFARQHTEQVYWRCLCRSTVRIYNVSSGFD